MKNEYKRCLNCDTIFYRQPHNKRNWHLKKYCCLQCTRQYNYYNFKKIRRQRIGFQSKKIRNECKWCEKCFIMTHKKHIYCSEKCRVKYHSYRTSFKSFKINSIKRCLYCKETFMYVREDQKFCSKICCLKHVDLRRSAKLKGRPKEKARKFGLTVEQSEKLRRACSICTFSKCINLHHIIPLSEGGKNEINNYLPMCPNCHKLVHTGYSIEEIKDYYKEKGIALQKEPTVLMLIESYRGGIK